MKKTIGILGGMGPEATALFFKLIIKNTASETDQDHIPIIIYNNPGIPSRVKAIFNHGESPVDALKQGIRVLEHSGSDFIAMPCITAHYFYKEIITEAGIPFYNMLDETVFYVKTNYPSIENIGLMASPGTVKTKIFHEAFSKEGMGVVCPEEKVQDKVNEAIFGDKGIKAGHINGKPRENILTAARAVIQSGAEALVAGCTEVPLAINQKDFHLPFFDPMTIMAEKCIIEAGYQTVNSLQQ